MGKENKKKQGLSIKPCSRSNQPDVKVSILEAYVHKTVLHLDRVGVYATGISIEVFSRFQGKGFFMKGTGYFGFVSLRTNHPPGQCHLHLVGAQVLTGIPFIPSAEFVNGNLQVFVFDTGTSVFRKCAYRGSFKPGSDPGRSCRLVFFQIC